MTSADPSFSIIVPTRERADYLGACLATCISNPEPDLEILVLDNTSRDHTAQIVAQIADPRIRYVRNDQRLSMRGNFEKGVREARGRIIGFIGDDDGVFPFTVARVSQIFGAHDVEAVSAARAHYAWPDLLLSRRGMGLLPRGSGITIQRSRTRLRQVLADDNYYRLPCLYHGFVARTAIDRILSHQDVLFASGIVDAASAVALSMEDIRYAFSEGPIVINGGSSRSNGASQFGGGTEEEQARWKVEDDLGFLPGFDHTRSVGPLIVEAALRYAQLNSGIALADILDPAMVRRALLREVELRRSAGDPVSEALAMFDSAGLPRPAPSERAAPESRAARYRRLLGSFVQQRPVDLLAHGVSDVYGAQQAFAALLNEKRVACWHDVPEQVRTAVRMAKG